MGTFLKRGLRALLPTMLTYRLGALLYTLLCGDSPFRGRRLVDTFRAIQGTQPPPPSSRVEGVGPALDAVVLRAMQKDPALRQPSPAAFADELEAAR